LKSILERLDTERFEAGFVSWYSDHAAARLFELKTPFCRHSLGLRTEQPDTFKHALGLAVPTPFALYYYLSSRLLIGRHQPDVAYMNTGIGGYEPAIVAADQLGVPVVCHLRRSRTLDSDERRAARRVARFVASSRWGVRHIEEQLGRPATDVDYVPEGIDLTGFDARAGSGAPPALPAGPVYVCIVGSLIARKRPLLAIEAFARARPRYSGLRLVLAGDGPLRDHVEQAVRAAGLETSVLRLGYVGAVPALLRRCHVGLLVSESEGMPNAVMEYMAAGLPVVTSAVPGVDELVDHGRTGLIVPDPIAPDAVAEALLALAVSADRRASFGRAGREKIEEEVYRVETESRGVADVLLRAAGRSLAQPRRLRR
jgi:glycosyltransferase involved in cell wall biosynthesis